MASLLGDGGPGDVRVALDPTLTAEDLPDATIAAPPYLGAAEAELLRRVPGADVLMGASQGPVADALYRALVYLCAARLAPTMPLLLAEQVGQDYRYQRQAVDLRDLARRLRSRAQAEIQSVLSPATRAAGLVPALLLATGGRGARPSGYAPYPDNTIAPADADAVLVGWGSYLID